MRLKGKRVLVIGASGGIGEAIAVAAMREGATVGAHFHARKLGISGVIEVPFDVRDPSGPSGVTRGVESFAGDAGLDALVNCAGVHRAEPLVQATDDAIREQLEVNLAGAIFATRAALGVMLGRRRAGTIVHVGSDVAQYPARGGSVYAATKGAIESLVRAIAVEYARKNVRAFCVAPGPIDTKMLNAARALSEDEVKARSPEGRIAAPEELAALCMAILAENERFSNGSVIPFNAAPRPKGGS